MATLPPDHPERYALAEEVHARQPEPLQTPTRASHVALLVEPESRDAERAHLAALCAQHGIEPPPADVNHFSARLGALRFKWERHGEFSGLTVFAAGGVGEPFDATAASLLPAGWLAALPGRTVFAGHAELRAVGDAEPPLALLAQCFGPQPLVGSEVGDGAGLAYTDFRIQPDGAARFLLLDRGLTPRQAGRMLQRLFEIETYRMMALLALPIARAQSPRIAAIERALTALTEDIARNEPERAAGRDEALLQQLTRRAAEVESELAASQFRYGACRAYAELVMTRIHELRERRLPGLPTVEEFMTRRFTPAVATCATMSQRLHGLSERVAQIGSLLSTRVDIVRERQNQALLASMDRRAKLQLRLQQTVEGLSVAAIVYYAAGLVGYAAKGLKAGGLRIDPDLAVGLAIPVVALLVLWTLRRARRHATDAERAAGH